MTDDQRVLYDNAGEVRNTDVMLRWSIAGIFLMLHTAGGVFVSTQLMAGQKIFIGVYLGGLALGLIWWVLNVRMQRWINYWNGRMEILEAEAGPQTIRVFGGDEYRAILMNQLSTYRILITLNWLIILGWFVVFEITLFSR